MVYICDARNITQSEMYRYVPLCVIIIARTYVRLTKLIASAVAATYHARVYPDARYWLYS